MYSLVNHCLPALQSRAIEIIAMTTIRICQIFTSLFISNGTLTHTPCYSTEQNILPFCCGTQEYRLNDKHNLQISQVEHVLCHFSLSSGVIGCNIQLFKIISIVVSHKNQPFFQLQQNVNKRQTRQIERQVKEILNLVYRN